MAVFASPLKIERWTSLIPAAEEALEDAAADDPVDDALDQRPGADQVPLGVEHQVVGDPGRDLGADRLVVERDGRPLGELVRVEQRVGGVARDRREQQRHRRQDREQRRPDPLPLAHPRQPSHAPGGRAGAANLGRLLRALLDIALDDERFAGLAGRTRAGEAVDLRASGPIRPYLLAALLDADEGLASRPALVVAADDVGARDLARALGAYLAPRRVRYYPSRGTGYESHLAPPPHLVGLRIGALDALTGAGDGDEPPIVVASAVALAEAVPDASLRPAGFVLHQGEEVDLDDVAELLVEAGYERTDQVEDRGQFSVRGGILDVFGATEDRAARLELFGDEIESIRWFSTFTQRSLGEAERIELNPAAELALEHRELAEVATDDDGEARRRARCCRSTRSGRRSI